MEKKVNLADKAKAMELLKDLYGTEPCKIKHSATISSNPSEGTTREERGRMAYRMGAQPAFNQGCHNPYSKRRPKIEDRGPFAQVDGVKTRGK